MKALSLTQPWASLVVMGEKKLETRSWMSRHFGLTAIHASQGLPKKAKIFSHENKFVKPLFNQEWFEFTDQFTLGAIIGTVEVIGYLPTERFTSENEVDRKIVKQFTGEDFTEKEKSFGIYTEERFVWILKNPRILETPIPCKGALSLWEVPKAIESQIV